MQVWHFKLIKALAFIHKMDGLSDSDFRDYYENKHAPLASSLLSLEGYERNYINSKINPLLPSLGSISIFKYQSIESLNVIIKFMDVSKNYFFLTQSDQLTEKEFNKKIFYSANNEDDLLLVWLNMESRKMHLLVLWSN